MEQLIEQGMFQQLPSVMSSQRLYVKLPTIIPDLAVVYRYGITEDTPTRLVRLIPTPPSQPQ